jgi:transcriptional regulator with XRE-family HTH domain
MFYEYHLCTGKGNSMYTAQALGVRIAQVRNKRHMSIQDLSERSEVSFPTVWKIEQGHHKDPGVFTITKIAEALHCSIDYLVGMYDEEKAVG